MGPEREWPRRFSELTRRQNDTRVPSGDIAELPLTALPSGVPGGTFL